MVALHLHANLVHDPSLLCCRFSPAGLRSSGATQDFLARQSLDRVFWRGRWASLPVLKHYLHLVVYHIASISFPPGT